MKAPPCAFNEIVDRIQVLTMEARTRLSPAELGERLEAVFGADGLGLELQEEGAGSLTFRGAGGHVSAAFRPAGDRTLLRITTSGWAAAVKRFVAELP